MIPRCSGRVFAAAKRSCAAAAGRRFNPSVDFYGLASREISPGASLASNRSNTSTRRILHQSSLALNTGIETIAIRRIHPSIRYKSNNDRPLPLWSLLGLSSRSKIPQLYGANALVRRSGYSIHVRQFSSSGKESGSSVGTNASSSSSSPPPSSTVQRSVVQKLPEWHNQYGIAVLFLAVLLTPIVIEQMKQSDSTYEEIEVDDALRNVVSDIAKDIEGSDLEKAFGIEREPRSLSEEEDDETRAVGNFIDVVSDVLNSEALQSAIASLVTRVVQSSQFQDVCHSLLRNLWNDLVNDPETTTQIVQLLNNAIKNDEIRLSVRELVLQLIQDEEVYKQFTNLVVRLGEDREVLDATQALLTESAHQALNDPEILDHSMEFATDVVGDDIVQRTSGEALRNTVSYAVQPGLSTVLAFAGVALVFISFSALSNVRSSTKEDAVVDAALSSPAFQEHAGRLLERVTNLLLLPWTATTAVGKGVANVALLPFNVASSAVYGLVRMGKSASSAARNLPSSVLDRLVDHIGSYAKPISARCERMGNAMSTSIVGCAIRSTCNGATEMLSRCSKAFVKLPSLTRKVEDMVRHLSTDCLATISQCMTSIERSSRSAIVGSHNASKNIGVRLIAIAGTIISKTGAWSSHCIESIATCISWLRGLAEGYRQRRGHI